MSTTLSKQLADQSSTEPSSPYIFFWKVAELYGDFSQWSYSPFTLNTKSFTNTEQFMMYHKAILMSDHSTAATILQSTNSHPAKYKKLGRQVKNFDQKLWDEMSLSVVVVGNLAKFTSDEELKEVLLGTGEKMIVEASPFDRIWGIGFTEGNAMANRDRWGVNRLGEALMIVRRIIRERESRGGKGPFVDTDELRDVAIGEDMSWLRSMDLFVDE